LAAINEGVELRYSPGGTLRVVVDGLGASVALIVGGWRNMGKVGWGKGFRVDLRKIGGAIFPILGC
jgi:hypothetical protein